MKSPQPGNTADRYAPAVFFVEPAEKVFDEALDLNISFVLILLNMTLSSETYFFIAELLKLLKNLYLRP